MRRKKQRIDCDVLVVGSGPGGANSALKLAEAGYDVLMVEEGDSVNNRDVKSYSLEEMNERYRNGGLTPAFGKTKVAYIEACCQGGASEINAALYHKPFDKTLQHWKSEYKIDSFGEKELEPFFKECEQDISVNLMPDGLGPASNILKNGADILKWKSGEVPRCWKYSKNKDGSYTDSRQSISRAIIPKAISKGCRLLTNIKVKRLVLKGKNAQYAYAVSSDENGQFTDVQIFFHNVFLCAGAIQTPLILRRSGIKHNIGNSLCMHPAVRVVAQFKDQVNDEKEGVPVLQVQEFKPRITLGGSYSGRHHLALWIGGKGGSDKDLESWKNMAMFYALSMGTGRGIIRNIPVLDEAFVRLPVTDQDLLFLGEGLYRLGKLLFEAGAVKIFSPIAGVSSFNKVEDLEVLKKGLPAENIDLSTIHLFSSCPMGEDVQECAVNSFGKVHGYNNIYLNDASILPSPPGVNPQALIMSLARRNCQMQNKK